jgi:hypothetical protein
MSESSEELKRIANALEEILRLVKLDQEATKKRWEYEPEEDKPKNDLPDNINGRPYKGRL